jgi:hypothetical protein
MTPSDKLIRSLRLLDDVEKMIASYLIQVLHSSDLSSHGLCLVVRILDVQKLILCRRECVLQCQVCRERERRGKVVTRLISVSTVSQISVLLWQWMCR